MNMKKIKQTLINLPNKSKLAASLLKFINIFRPKKKIINQASHAENVFNLINSLSVPVIPFFGTLLSIYREKNITYADDFDFATTNTNVFTSDFIEEIENKGAALIAVSVVDKELVELSFDLNGAKIDIFYLDSDDEYYIHRCPNFRKERAQKEFTLIEKNIYTSYFQVKYPIFGLKKDDFSKLSIPDNCSEIFIRHYGNDWMIPKKNNFIDFKSYEFINKESYSAFGCSENIKKHLLDNNLLSNK